MATAQVTYGTLDDDEFEYPMRHRARGLAYIVNNYQFDKLDPRPFSGVDRDALIGALDFVGFKSRHIKHRDNLTASEMETLMEDASKQDYTKLGCLFVAILTHGDEESVWGTDRPISYEQLLQPLRVASMRNLEGVPKIIIIQACKQDINAINLAQSYHSMEREQEIVNSSGRSRVVPPSVKRSHHMMETDAAVYLPVGRPELGHDAEIAGSGNPYCTSPESDFLIAYSVLSGTGQGSRFIQAFCEVMKLDGRKLELAKLLAIVSRLMSYTPGTSMPNKKQPHLCVISQLRKELFFS